MRNKLTKKNRRDIERYMHMRKEIPEFQRYLVLDETTVKIDFRSIPDGHKFSYLKTSPGSGLRCLSDADSLIYLLHEYFSSLKGAVLDKRGERVTDHEGNQVYGLIKPPTLSGIARTIGISTQTLINFRRGRRANFGYSTSDRFQEILKVAVQMVEEYAEGRIYDREGSSGAQFVLSAGFGWVTSKEEAEMRNLERQHDLRKQEFDLKRKILEGAEADGEITINVVRGAKDSL